MSGGADIPRLRLTVKEMLDGYPSIQGRLFLNSGLNVACWVVSLLALLPLMSIIFLIVKNGFPLLSWELFTELPPAPGLRGGGIGNALVGTAMMVSIGLFIASPVGVLAAIYICEYSPASRLSRMVRFTSKLLTGIPSIICGVFAFAVVVTVTGHFSAIAGGVALAVLSLPVIIMTTEQALLSVANSYRQASYALGATRAQTIIKIVLPKASPAIMTGHMLALARAAGETAPVLVTALFNSYWNMSPLQPTASLPVLIYNFSSIPYDYQVKLAWTASLVLVFLVTITNIAAQWLLSPEGNKFIQKESSTQTVGDMEIPGKNDFAQNEFVKLPSSQVMIEIENYSFSYKGRGVLHHVSMQIPRQSVTVLIGPSGSGKSTLLRSFNRMNDLVSRSQHEGDILILGRSIFKGEIRSINLRRCVGMVFQKVNPFPRSIYENVAYGVRMNGERRKKIVDEIVEESLVKVGLWEEVKDRLKESPFTLSGGQMQRVCIARTIACHPQIILLDEPCSGLDPISTAKIEELIQQLKKDHTVILVTHNLEQAARCGDYVAYFSRGRLIEYSRMEKIFMNPDQDLTRHYITGRFAHFGGLEKLPMVGT